MELIPDGAKGGALQCGHTQLLRHRAPGNIHAQRGTLAFSWRSREPVGPTAFPVFRVGYADHSSWDMVWLRIDYNGKSGFDAFVTDASLSRQRVSMTLPAFPRPDQWIHLALAWDETRGIRFYVDGKLAGTVEGATRLDAALDQFGPHSRVISPIRYRVPTTSSGAATSTNCGSTIACCRTTTWRGCRRPNPPARCPNCVATSLGGVMAR